MAKKKITIEVDEKVHKKFSAAVKKKKTNLTARLVQLIKSDLAV